ncbi:MAG TPA: TolC family protein [Stellaceae bacterium]|nr:TolC family protein [Stellaceae bacterium]
MAPDRADRPWHPATTASGEIVPGDRGTSEASAGSSYVLPSNTDLSNIPPAYGTQGDRAYSLAELIDIAESNNPFTRKAWNDGRKVALAEGIAESTYLPSLTATVVGGYQAMNGNKSAFGVSANSDLTASGGIAAVSLQWLLFDFGERAAVVDTARQASVIANIAFTAAHQQVIYDVSVAFYANAAARARVGTATESLKNAEAVQAAAEDRKKRGIGTVVEVAQARQATAQARLMLVEATGAAQDSYLKLISAMGISPLTKMKIADVSDRQLPTGIGGSIEQFISEALARRPDVLSAYAAEKAAASQVEAARDEFLPKLFLSASGAYNTGGLGVSAIPGVGQQSGTVNLTGNQFGGTILGGITVPLYDGGKRSAVLEQARATADNASVTLTHTREEAMREIVLADNALQTSLSAYAAAQSLTSAAQTTFDAALAAYRNGVGSITDLTIAETQLLQAKDAATNAYSTALSTAATLALAAGALGSAPE